MTRHLLPALDGRSALGWLATLGLLRLLDEESKDPRVRDPRLSWNPRTAQARLTVPGSLDDLVDVLQSIVEEDITGDALLPNGPAKFPGSTAPKEWPRADPMRMPHDAFDSTLRTWRATHPEVTDRWVPALVTDQVTDDQGCVALTSYAAPSGQQKFSTMLSKPLSLVRKDIGLLREALSSWQRANGVTGEYLDHRVLRSAADTPEGASNEAGVPGATWLALMALPWLPVRGSAGEALASGWQVRSRQRPVMVWPLWRDDLPVSAVRTLITHPALRISQASRSEDGVVNAANLRPLSVFTVCGASRQPIPGRKSAGVLTPITVAMR